MDTFSAEIPQTDSVGVEIPGVVRSISHALEAIGGRPGIARAVGSASTILPLQLRVGEPISHPIYGEKHNGRGLLVRYAKRGGELQGKVVARVGSFFHFQGMADFQYVADETLAQQNDGLLVEKLEGVYGTEHEPLLTLPPLFTRLDMPMEYQFRSFYGEDPPAFRGPGGAKTKGQLPQYVLKSISLRVPPPVLLPELIEGSFKPEKRELLKALHSILANRPIWCAFALHDELPSPKPPLNELEALMPRVAYTFRSGPFAFLWIRRGYDPRSDQQAKMSQATCYTLSNEWHERIRSSNDVDVDDEMNDADPLPPIAASYSQLKRFQAVPKQQSTLLQLCDLEDPQISDILQHPSRSHSYDSVTGWLTTDEIEAVSRRVTTLFDAILQSAGNQAPFAATQGALPAVSSTPMSLAGEDKTQGRGQVADIDTAPGPVASPSGHDEDRATADIVPTGVLQSLVQGWGQALPSIDEAETASICDLTGGQEPEEFEIFEDDSEEIEDEAESDDEDDE